ncbi:MAG: ribosome small subunit-dependent GTPase A [Bdellovibrionales bacterium]|nr:ribosome small subunit-dependent GTPase A [Bdellovibrionales bacterium]
MNLNSLGWSNLLMADPSEVECLARIIAVHRSHLRAIDIEGELNIHLSSGIEEIPTVGDWVVRTPRFVDEQNENAALIRRVVKRYSDLLRVKPGEGVKKQALAANIDIVFVVVSANDDFNINRLQRYLILIKEGGANAVVLISKTDLNPNYTLLIEKIRVTIGPEVPVVCTNQNEPSTFECVRSLILKEKTAVFVGSSGAGKSTLVNFLLNREVQKTSEIRESDSKGRHTTTGRSLFVLSNGGMIIDTPGIREVGVWGDKEALLDAFPNITKFAKECRFSDCNHSSEPDCGIRQALLTGAFEGREWDNYLKLKKEMDYFRRKADRSEAQNTKKRWKQIHRQIRQKRKFESNHD